MPPPNVISTTKIITALARSGQISYAQKLFNEMPQKDTICFNAMLTSYLTSNLPHQTLHLFSSMLSLSYSKPDHFSLTSAFTAASRIADIHVGTQLHSLTIRLGFTSLPTHNSIINMYAKCMCPFDAARAFNIMEEHNVVSWCSLLNAYINCGLLLDAVYLFDEMPLKNIVAWNIAISGFYPSKALELFTKMYSLGINGDELTYSGVMNACVNIEDSRIGCMIHCMAYRNGLVRFVEVGNSTLSFYGAFGMKDRSLMVFEEMLVKSQVSWNAIIEACMKGGDIDNAMSLFEQAPMKNTVSWTSLVSGFSKNGDSENALSMFSKMLKNSYKPDDFAFGAALQACATIVMLKFGETLHGYIIKLGFGSFVYVVNSVMNMYAKCGNIEASKKVFFRMKRKDIVSWNSMILGFALHGHGSEAFETYNKMAELKVVPDKITVLGLLIACSHSGLVEEAERLMDGLESIDKDQLMCVIDMVVRTGNVEAVKRLINESENGDVGRVMGVNFDMGVGKRVGEEMVREEPESEEGYVMLSNLYCANGRWMEAERVRKEMEEKGVKKIAGCSWIEVGNDVHVFVCGSKSVDVLMVGLNEMVCDLHTEMRNSCLLLL